MASAAPEPAPSPVQPLGIVVPAATPPDMNKDSVELLLDGITGPQPERTRTKPQTDGEAAAAYHARHDVRAARTSPDEEPKVVIERVAQPPTIRIDRSRLPRPDAEIARAALEPTAIVPPQLAPRIVLAILSGLVVVLVMFLALRMASTHMGGAVAAPVRPPPPAATVEQPAPSALSPSVIANVGAAARPDESELPIAAASAATPTAPPAPEPSAASADPAPASPELTSHPRPVAGASSSVAGKTRPKTASSAVGPKDLGELKTTFH